MKKATVAGKKNYVTGSAGGLEMEALRCALERIGESEFDIWGCIHPDEIKRAKTVFIGDQILKVAIDRAEFAKRRCPKGVAVGFANGRLDDMEIAEILVIGENGKRIQISIDFSNEAEKAEMLTESIVSALQQLKEKK